MRRVWTGRALCPPAPLLIALGISAAQPLVLPPAQPTPAGVERFRPAAAHTRLEGALHADTNVRPLFREASTLADAGDSFYYQSSSMFRFEHALGRWRVGYAYGQAERFRGNRGAAQLFLEAEQGELRNEGNTTVWASMNRSAVHRWSLGLEDSATIGEARLRYRLTAHYLVLQRLQVGTLIGQRAGNQFDGALRLTTTRGLPPQAIDGQGVALDAEATIEWRRWLFGARVENLCSALEVQQAQLITAQVRVNQLIPDADGFLRAPPLLEGRVERVQVQTHAARTAEVCATYATGGAQVALLIRYDFDWRLGVGMGRSGLWSVFWLHRPAWQVGYSSDRWQAMLMMDGWSLECSRRVSASLGYAVVW
jgi:hypothetical protein